MSDVPATQNYDFRGIVDDFNNFEAAMRKSIAETFCIPAPLLAPSRMLIWSKYTLNIAKEPIAKQMRRRRYLRMMKRR